jgi:FAD/FMN-containing dehydrogenase
VNTPPDGFVERLVAIVGSDQVLVDADQRASFEEDWTRRFRGHSLAVVRPGSTAEVAAIVDACRRESVAIVPQGGNTGLVGGGVPLAGGVVVSLRRLRKVREIDTATGQITVEAGLTLAEVAAACADTGWEFGVDLGARDVATIGGMIATNAGGTRVLRYGMMRHNLLGVEAVLGDGSTISHLHGLLKDNTGYDLAGLLCGSEGTLGIVTAARLRLVPAWPDRWRVAINCTSWSAAVEVAVRLRRDVDGLDGLEAVDAAGQRIAAEHLGLRLPFGGPVPVMLLAAWAGRGDPPEAFGALLEEHHHVVVTDNAAWEVRERQAEAIARVGIPHKMDITVPVARLAAFCDDVAEVVNGQLFLFGHLGDGNLHVNVVGPDPEDPATDRRVLGLVAASGGSISAEHGIGRLKAASLGLVRTPSEIAAFRAIKSALDPGGVMNPGVVISDPG